MTLRLKIHLIVGALMLAFMAAMFGLQLQSMRASVNEEIAAAHRVALQMLNRITWAYAAQGTPALRHYLQGLGRVRAHDILLFDAAGNELYRSPPSPYKQGRDAPQWFQALVAPQTLAQSISFPDGRLELRADASRSVLDAWDELTRLAGVALAALLLANALVYWLVGRTVRPFGHIVQALEGLQAGGFDRPMPPLPPLPGREAHAIGEAYNRMLEQLRHHLETERRADRAEAQLADSRELTRWIDQHVEAERRLIARELHDELGQSVTAMRSLALGIARRTQTGDAPSAQAAQTIADEASRLYDAMHGIIPRLTPLVLDHFGLVDALGDLASRTRRAHPDLQLTLHTDLGERPVDAEMTLALYRAAQEGLTNALRHGEATQVRIDLVARATPVEQVELCVTDNGHGPPAEPRSTRGHHGLAWLGERAQSLGGSLNLEPVPPRGARLRLRLPMPSSAPPIEPGDPMR
ncbi:ATP-binding protein [Sphaerotilus microaerophilus]|uniref:histidine kinase n=1 Tax=Sphaerotilus microaerophilus TaxID=2914710 RepID=A0ABN6PPN6_9BURK|nr:ATP-binding protein [Sphaerotilus sp. FB-5]BDI05577.1 sensor histidine kinase [Sphaerotilus sp. FB-5]